MLMHRKAARLCCQNWSAALTRKPYGWWRCVNIKARPLRQSADDCITVTLLALAQAQKNGTYQAAFQTQSPFQLMSIGACSQQPIYQASPNDLVQISMAILYSICLLDQAKVASTEIKQHIFLCRSCINPATAHSSTSGCSQI